MLSCAVIAAGKLKESHWRDAQAEFLKRLRPFARVTVTEVDAERLDGGRSAAQAMAVEGQRLKKALPKDAFVIALTPEGKAMHSEKFAGYLETHGGGGRTLAFVIGGTAGIDPDLAMEADARLSLSPLTFTHELARVVLLEQLYRAITILSGKAYHR